MDANKFMTEYQRMCTRYSHCVDCPLCADRQCAEIPARYTKESLIKLIKVVEDWAAAHPVTTRADLFKNIYPNAAIDPFGALYICPADLSTNFKCEDRISCVDCRKEYWTKEVNQ